MVPQQQKQRPSLPPEYQIQRLHRIRWLIAGVALVFIVAGISIWILTSRSVFTSVLPLVLMVF